MRFPFFSGSRIFLYKAFLRQVLMPFVNVRNTMESRE